MKRRHFLRYSLAGAAMLSSFPYHLYAGTKRKYVTDTVMLGDTGIEMSRMAMGTGTNGYSGSSNQTRRLGIKGLSDLLQAGYDDGINFWDSADQYGSHPHMKEALKKVPREKVVILTKSHASTYDEMNADLERFRKEIGTDYIDIVLLHAITDPNWNKKRRGAMDALDDARNKGLVRAQGISCHSLGALETAADEPWVQVDLARFNPAGVAMDSDVDTVRKVLERMKKNGKGIVGMKVYGAGKLVNRKDECLEFQAAHEFMDSFTLGIENYDQLKDIEKRYPESSVRG
ncbi:MAG TPA: aldo/keto reductase [Bacteroidales bacterium]|nr:aldo/keto reductase [Bacteroidales bacterium]